MRHHVEGRKLGRTTAHRIAMLANLASSLIRHDRIETTLPKAKELRSLAERLVTLGKRKTLHARRKAISLIRDKGAVHKLFADIAGRFAGRNGGYTRILKLGMRHGDAAPMAIIEYVMGALGSGATPSEKAGAPMRGKEKSAKQHKPSEKRAAGQKLGKKSEAQPHSKGKPMARRTASARKAPTGE